MRILAGLVVTLAALGFGPTARASTIIFDADGSGGMASPTAIGSFTFSAGNALSLSSVPLTDGKSFPLLYQAVVAGFQDANGDPIGNPTGLNSSYQITFVMRFNETAHVDATKPNAATFTVDANQTGSFVEFYFNNNPATFASSLLGTGFNSGRLILQGTPSATLDNNGNFSITVDSMGNPVLQNLDQFNANNYPAIQTVIGSGDAKIGANVETQDTAFFQSPVPILTYSISGGLRLPFTDTNPSFLFDGLRNLTGLGTPGPVPIQLGASIASVGARNGLDGPNFIQQVAASTASFEPVATPEPATISGALLGIGFFGLRALRARRRRTETSAA